MAVVALLTTATGLLFKIAAIPFHQWLPDAYEGAPTSVTGFMSVAVKAAAWAMLLRIFLWGLYPLRSVYVPLLIFVSIATMTGANLAALTQNNLKRLLAYSSIAHVGYMLLGLVALASVEYPAPAFFDGFKGILLYLLVYTFMNLGAFAVVTSLRQRNVIGDEIDDIAGLFSRAPTEAVLMLIFLLSLAGIPPLAGFYGKYFIFLSLMESGHYILASVAVLYAVFGLYYYMRIANAMFMSEALDKTRLPISIAMRVALGVTAFATVVIGVFPERFHTRGDLVDGPRLVCGLCLAPTATLRKRKVLWCNWRTYSQLAFIFPAATVAGWLLGLALDHWLHTTWLYLAGLIVGIIAGFVELIRTVTSSKNL